MTNPPAAQASTPLLTLAPLFPCSPHAGQQQSVFLLILRSVVLGLRWGRSRRWGALWVLLSAQALAAQGVVWAGRPWRTESGPPTCWRRDRMCSLPPLLPPCPVRLPARLRMQKSSSSASSEASETCQSVSECSSPTSVSAPHLPGHSGRVQVRPEGYAYAPAPHKRNLLGTPCSRSPNAHLLPPAG